MQNVYANKNIIERIDEMRKTSYISWNLDNPEEAYLYQYLESLGRNKKTVIKLALKNMTILQQVPTYQTQSVPIKRKPKSEQKEILQSEKTISERSVEIKTVDTQVVAQTQPVQNADTVIPETKSEIPESASEENVPLYKKYLTQNQIDILDSLRQQYQILNDIQLQVLRDDLDAGLPPKAAFAEASFTQ